MRRPAESGLSQWIDEIRIQSKDVEVLGRFDNPFYAGVPAITRRRYRKGWAYYLGALLSQDGYYKFYKALVAHSGLKPILDFPEGLYAFARVKGRRKIIFVNNPDPETRTCRLPEPCIDILTGRRLKGKVALNPFDVLVLGY